MLKFRVCILQTGCGDKISLYIECMTSSVLKELQPAPKHHWSTTLFCCRFGKFFCAITKHSDSVHDQNAPLSTTHDIDCCSNDTLWRLQPSEGLHFCNPFKTTRWLGCRKLDVFTFISIEISSYKTIFSQRLPRRTSLINNHLPVKVTGWDSSLKSVQLYIVNVRRQRTCNGTTGFLLSVCTEDCVGNKQKHMNGRKTLHYIWFWYEAWEEE